MGPLGFYDGDKLIFEEARQWQIAADATFTFRTVAHYDSASSNSAACNKPANTVDGDIMFAIVMRTVAAAPTTVPTGWAEIYFPL